MKLGLCASRLLDHKHLVSGSKTGELQCWDPKTGKPGGSSLILSLNHEELNCVLCYCWCCYNMLTGDQTSHL